MTDFLGVRLFIWIYFLLSIVLFLGVIIYLKRELIKKIYYKIRFPEKLIKCIIHYKSGLFKEYWRIIPDKEYYTIEKKKYLNVTDNIVKKEDVFAKPIPNKEDYNLVIEGIKYNLLDKYKIKNKGRTYPEIHYIFNNPKPIDYNASLKKIQLTAKQLNEFEENDLFSKLLTLQEEKQLIMMCIIIGVINLIATGFLIAKYMEWI